MPTQTKRIARAFTLIELLVVMSIIGVLVATLLPAIAKARAVAKSAVCMSNQRGITQMVHYYIDDNKQYFPPSADGINRLDQYWYTKLAIAYLNLQPYNGYYSYIGDGKGSEKIFRCPESSDATAGQGIEATLTLQYGWNFTALTHLDLTDPTNHGQSAKLSQVEDPAKTIVIGDSGNYLSYVIRPYNSFWMVGTNAYAPVFRHSEKAGFAMVDGHVEMLPMDPVGLETMPYWPMHKY